MVTRISWLLLLLLMVSNPAVADPFSFDGDTIHGSLSSPISGFVSVPFAASAVVGPGPEFTGVLGSGQFQWNISLDITGREIAVSVASVVGSFESAAPWSISLTDLNFTAPSSSASIAGVFSEGVVPSGTVRFFGNNITSTADSIFIPYDITSTYVEHLLIISTVPEPSLGMLACLALAVCGILRRSSPHAR